jgi:hypothetical protein
MYNQAAGSNSICLLNQVPYKLEQLITTEEILLALRKESKHKATGIDGISLEFYTVNWKTIQPKLLDLHNQMFLHKKITPRQKHSIIICLPKANGVLTPDVYRPISLSLPQSIIFQQESWPTAYATFYRIISMPANTAAFLVTQFWMRYP